MAKSALAHSTRLDAATHAAKASQNYAVRSGDTLASISDHVYGKSGDWQWLYHVNSKTISDPNLIYPGQVLNVPADPPANYTLPASAVPATTSSVSNAPASGYRARHAAPVAQNSGTGSGSGTGCSARVSGSGRPRRRRSRTSPGATPTSAGTYSCGGLEALWEEAGGSPGEAVMAAEIAMAESGGNPRPSAPPMTSVSGRSTAHTARRPRSTRWVTPGRPSTSAATAAAGAAGRRYVTGAYVRPLLTLVARPPR